MSSNGAVTDDDTFVLIMLSPWLLPIAVGAVMGAWDRGRQIALDSGIIADADEAIVGIPGWGGAGLSGVHVVVLACIVVALTVVAGVFSRRRRTPRGEMNEPPPFRGRL